MKPLKNFKLPSNKQGIVIDVLMIVINIFLFPVFAERIDGLFGGSFDNTQSAFITLGVLLGVLLFGRLGGLFLKRLPLQVRMRSTGGDFSAYFLVLSAPLMILSAIGAWVVIEQFAAAVGWLAADASGAPVESRAMTILLIFVVMFLTVSEIYLLFRLGKRLSSAESSRAAKGGLLYGGAAEFVADFGLFAYMSLWQVVYYGVAAWLLRTPGAPQGAGYYIFRVVIVALCFALFYLSPRAVFLTEDRKYLSTWIFIALVFVSSLLPHWLQNITGLFF
ncbi:MAG TPA: hypothetical protein VGO50_13870 [Pyrinomonadaceae bacterium]|jgi:hypothetical protein|nr:hypothetical protein [Pyrinomonadaceae bacterium]